MVTITLSIAAEYEDTYRPNTGTIIVLATIAGGLAGSVQQRHEALPMCCHRAAYQRNGIRRRRTLFRYPR